MTQPSYVPIVEADQVRPSYRVQAPPRWRADRPADHRGGPQPRRPERGTPGPDQGYALLLAERLFASRLQCRPGESDHDVLAVAAELGAARAASFGRAPVAADVELALVLLGALGDGPEELADWRAQTLRGASHDYRRRRQLVDQVPAGTWRLDVADARARLGQWRTLLGVEPPQASTTA
jgi:hypothetical protein